MFKILAAGLWVCAVMSASAYGTGIALNGAALWDTTEAADKREVLKPGHISVPIIADGLLQGYVMARFAVTVNATEAESLPVPVEGFFIDEAFRAIYTAKDINFSRLTRQDLPALSRSIAGSVNARLGVPVIGEVLVQELTYMPKEPGRPRPGSGR